MNSGLNYETILRLILICIFVKTKITKQTCIITVFTIDNQYEHRVTCTLQLVNRELHMRNTQNSDLGAFSISCVCKITTYLLKHGVKYGRHIYFCNVSPNFYDVLSFEIFVVSSNVFINVKVLTQYCDKVWNPCIKYVQQYWNIWN